MLMIHFDFEKRLWFAFRDGIVASGFTLEEAIYELEVFSQSKSEFR